MESTKFWLTWSLSLLTLILFVSRLPSIAGKGVGTFSAIYDDGDNSILSNDGDDNDFVARVDRRLPNGYYYVNDGQLKAVLGSGVRREDGKRLRFKPLVKVRRTKSKRKLFFVPNLFG